MACARRGRSRTIRQWTQRRDKDTLGMKMHEAGTVAKDLDRQKQEKSGIVPRAQCINAVHQ